MKLKLLALLAIAVIAAAIPTSPQIDTAASVPRAIDPKALKPDRIGPREIPFVEFWLQVNQFCEDGQVKVIGSFSTGSFSQDMSDFGSGAAHLVPIEGKNLNMRYFPGNQSIGYSYGDCKFGPDSASGKMCAWCNDMTNGWSSPTALKCGTGLAAPWRHRTTRCQLGIMHKQTRDVAVTPDAPKNIVARELDTESDDNPMVATATHALRAVSTPAPTAQNGPVGYYLFGLIVIEYCGKSQGNPLMAKGYWWPDGANGLDINFNDGRTVTEINIGYAKKLQVGWYDYYKHRASFQYGDCKWNQDHVGDRNCGYCTSRPWSGHNLNCASNAAATRSHQIDCMVAVQGDQKALPPAPKLKRIAAPPTSQPTPTPAQTSELTKREIRYQYSFVLTDYCENNERKAKGWYIGGKGASVALPRGLITAIAHGEAGYSPLMVGPFDFATSHLRFSHESGHHKCTWDDNESNKWCGECRAGQWTTGELDCSTGSEAYRDKTMNCTFVLGGFPKM